MVQFVWNYKSVNSLALYYFICCMCFVQSISAGVEGGSGGQGVHFGELVLWSGHYLERLSTLHRTPGAFRTRDRTL